MRFAGHVHKDGKFWVAEVPMFEAMTQGRTRREALAMTLDWFETMADVPGFSMRLFEKSKLHFEVGSNSPRVLIRLLLQRRREISGLSLADMARRLGARSRNAYARYERGSSTPTVEKLDELLRVVSPGKDYLIQETA